MSQMPTPTDEIGDSGPCITAMRFKDCLDRADFLFFCLG
jgi:hypothetical protein